MTLVLRLLLASLRPPALALLTMAALVAVPAFAATPLVVVANILANSVTHYAVGDQGDVSPAKKIVGAATGLNQPTCSFVYGAELYVVNRDSVTVYPFGTSGDVPPTRTISGASTELHNPHHCFVDSGELFVANTDGGALTVYDAHDSGDVAPKRKLSVGGTRGVAVSGSELFVAQDAGSVVWVYDKTATDPATPTRTISGASTQLGGLAGVAVNGGDLFVLSTAVSAVLVFNVTDDGNVVPKRVIAGPNTGFTAAVAAWVYAGELFVVDYPSSVRVFNAGDDGNVAPKRVIAGASTGISHPYYVSVSPDLGPIAWWPAEGNANDVVGGHNGTLQGGASFASGRVGQAFQLDGSDDVIAVADAPDLNFGANSPMTISLWAYPTTTSMPHIMGKRGTCWDAGQSIHYMIGQDAPYGLFFASGGGLIASGQYLDSNRWQQVVVTFDGATVRLYVDSEEWVAGPGALGALNNGAPVIIGGAGAFCAPFPGRLDEVKIYDRALSAQEIAANYAAESPPVLASAASRKVHGAAGTFNLPLSRVPSTPTVEPRQGPAQTIVFTFDKAINGATATVTEGTATASTPTISGNDVIVSLTGVNNQQYVTIALTDVASIDGATGSTASVRIGFLLGDVNQNRSVSLSDLGQVNAQIAQPVTAANYLKDVNVSGTLSLADKGITNTQVTRTLPAP